MRAVRSSQPSPRPAVGARALLVSALILVSVAAAFPLAWMVLSSLKTPAETMQVQPLWLPRTLGMLLALYGHKVFVQNTMWGVNAFDQPGVELGKRLATRILPHLEAKPPPGAYDASTASLIAFYQANRRG